MKLTSDLVESFAGTFLSPRYDNPEPTPDFHREAWSIYCSDAPNVALAAPRDHAKSTALTHDFTLAVALFRVESYIIVVSSSEEMTIEHIHDISAELHENEDLIRDFGIKRFITDQKTDLVVECDDGYQFRIIARGAEQRIRGRKWNGKRPGLIICDDMEDDEQVENRDRREKFRKWFFRAAKQAIRKGGKIRVHGTVLHEDSLLARLLEDKNWVTRKFTAHRGFDDFRDILWPEKWSEKALRQRRAEFISQGDGGGYSAEFLNDPLDNDTRYFKKNDFISMKEDDFDKPMIICAAADFAVSKADKADWTAFSIGGKAEDNLLYVIDQRKERIDALDLIEMMFEIQARWDIAVFFVEDGVIWKSLSPMIYREMQKRDKWMNLQPLPSTKDKAIRGRSLQRRMRAGGVRFDKEADWYAPLEEEMMKFTGYARDATDDQVDSMTLLSRGFDYLSETEGTDFMTEKEEEFEREVITRGNSGRSLVTGY